MCIVVEAPCGEQLGVVAAESKEARVLQSIDVLSDKIESSLCDREGDRWLLGLDHPVTQYVKFRIVKQRTDEEHLLIASLAPRGKILLQNTIRTRALDSNEVNEAIILHWPPKALHPGTTFGFVLLDHDTLEKAA